MARTETKKDGFWETLKTVFWALVIAGVFRTLLFQPFSIPSGSMKPTLLIGDYLFVSKYSYGYSHYSLPFEPDWFDGRIWAAEPERGDVIVFKHPKRDACARPVLERIGGFFKSLVGVVQIDPGDCIDYVKRAVGLPGDELQVKGGILYINGEPLKTERIEDFSEPFIPLGSPPRSPRCINGPLGRGAACFKEQYLETLPNGRVHKVLNFQGEMGATPEPYRISLPDNTGIYTVPEDHLFFMGDNRDNSIDSRWTNQVGVVPYENLIGRADVIAFSSEGPFWQVWNWRFDRLFKAID